MMTKPAGENWPGPYGRPARPHWWSIQPFPSAAPISAARAYAEVLVVFLCFFAVGIIVGGEMLAGRYHSPAGSWAIYGPLAVQELAVSVLAVLVVVLLSARRGITPAALGLRWPRRADGRAGIAQSLRATAWTVLALAVGGAITVGLAAGHHLVQPARQDYSYLLSGVASSLAAGIVEELAVLAFVVTTLRQARRPLPEIVIVAVLLRCSYHDYYGLGVVGIAVWAAILIWLFLRTGSVLPMVVVHIFWDVCIFLSQRWSAIGVVRGYAIAAIYLTAITTWLVEVARRRSATSPGPA